MSAKLLRSAFSRITLLIIPHRCLCGCILTDQSADFCQQCWGKVGFVSPGSSCDACGTPFEFQMSSNTLCAECINTTPEFDKARFVFKYNDHSGRMITGLKYNDKTPYAKTLSKLMAKKLTELEDSVDIITAVPIHPKKLVKRKYNQSACLANNIGHLIKTPANNLLLKKIRDIPPQASLKRQDRLKNIKGAITFNNKYKSKIAGKNILLIDDVITTGATANECARILKQSGAAKVYLITAARIILE